MKKQHFTHLLAQSNFKYNFLKDEAQKLYYIKRIKDGKIALVGNKDDAEFFIIYGIDANKEDLTSLNFQ